MNPLVFTHHDDPPVTLDKVPEDTLFMNVAFALAVALMGNGKGTVQERGSFAGETATNCYAMLGLAGNNEENEAAVIQCAASTIMKIGAFMQKKKMEAILQGTYNPAIMAKAIDCPCGCGRKVMPKESP